MLTTALLAHSEHRARDSASIRVSAATHCLLQKIHVRCAPAQVGPHE